jgi:hypothetical protein
MDFSSQAYSITLSGRGLSACSSEVFLVGGRGRTFLQDRLALQTYPVESIYLARTFFL